jgi:hypothetical protein
MRQHCIDPSEEASIGCDASEGDVLDTAMPDRFVTLLREAWL